MSALLFKSDAGVFRVFAGWVDFAARRAEAYDGKTVELFVASAPYSTGPLVRELGKVEKTSAALDAAARRFKPTGTTSVFVRAESGRYELRNYLAVRAERKAKHEKKAAKKAAKLNAEQVEQQTAAIVSKVLAELQLSPKQLASQVIEYVNDGPTAEEIAAAEEKKP